MSIWKLIEKTLTATTTKVVELQKKKEELPVPTIVVTPVLEEREEYLEFGYKIEETPTIQVTEITPTTTPASSEDGNDEATQGLGISGVQYDDPLNEVDDLLAILGLDVEAEKEEVEDEIEKILEREIDGGLASKLVEKSRVLFLELGREWKEVVEREYLPAKQEAKSIIWESYAMEEFKKSNTAGSAKDNRVAVQISREEKLFAAIVLADVATKEVTAARVAAEKIHNLQTLALQKYATRLKDHKILPLASYRRYVRRVKRMEREMEGWRAKERACKRILVVGGEVLGLLETSGKAPGTPDSGYEE